jgi:transposase
MQRRQEGKRDRAKRELRGDSERLLKAIDELRDLEEQKRREPMSSAPFRELAEQVEAKAREVYRLADEEADDAHEAAGDEIAEPIDGDPSRDRPAPE